MSTNTEMIISVKELKKSFGKIEVLKGISTDIHRGEVVVIIGASGSGKSTFLRCLNRLEEPTDGVILFDGVDITNAKYSTLDGAYNSLAVVAGKTVTTEVHLKKGKENNFTIAL